jgi:hypothetical protein
MSHGAVHWPRDQPTCKMVAVSMGVRPSSLSLCLSVQMKMSAACCTALQQLRVVNEAEAMTNHQYPSLPLASSSGPSYAIGYIQRCVGL